MLENNFGKIQVYTGEGKGKTTAALGLTIRALGRDKKVVIIYFDKGGNDYGERNILNKLKGKNFQYYITGRQRFNSATQKFDFSIKIEDKNEADRGLKIVQDIFKENLVDLLILDEINSTISSGMVILEDFLEVLNNKPKNMELVLTGRNVHQKIIARADLVTEMKSIKHYFDQGVEAREGIEY